MYTSNRGEDTIAVMAIDPKAGTVRLIQSMRCGGKTPRFFALTPNGSFMHVLNEDSDSIVTFDVELQSGMLIPKKRGVQCGSPVCMIFSPS